MLFYIKKTKSPPYGELSQIQSTIKYRLRSNTEFAQFLGKDSIGGVAFATPFALYHPNKVGDMPKIMRVRA